MNRASGQSSVELVALVPLVLVLALGIVDAGVTVRDRIALADAAARAADAQMRGEDVQAAARAGLPASLRKSLRIDAEAGGITASVKPTARLARLAGDTRLETSVVTELEGAR